MSLFSSRRPPDPGRAKPEPEDVLDLYPEVKPKKAPKKGFSWRAPRPEKPAPRRPATPPAAPPAPPPPPRFSSAADLYSWQSNRNRAEAQRRRHEREWAERQGREPSLYPEPRRARQLPQEPHRHPPLNRRKILTLAGVALLIIIFIVLGRVLYNSEQSGSQPAVVPTVSGVAEPKERKQKYTLEEIKSELPQMEVNDQLLLINRDHKLPDIKFPLQIYNGTPFEMNPALVRPLDKLADDCREETGEQLRIESAYRSHEAQEKTYAIMPTMAQEPGASEHESGLALDLSVQGFVGMDFLACKSGPWVAENCWRYGFIIRYPKDKTDVTGIPYEPWHLRYVGQPHAQIMHEQNWTLEEYLQYLKPGQFFQFGDYIISRQPGPTFDFPKDWRTGSISPDNTGFYILTFKK